MIDFGRLLLIVAAIVLVALLTFVPLSANDFWLQVTIGEMIWRDGEIPRTALFPFTEAKDYPFIAHEWLPSVLFYALNEWLGYDHLLFVKGLLGLALFALCYRLARRLTNDTVIAILLALAAMVVANYRHFLRPETLAMLFLVVQLNLLVEYELTGRKRMLAWLVPLSMLWANCHGSFPIALVIMAFFAGGAAIDRWRKERAGSGAAATPYLVAAAAMALAMLVNPYGWRLFAFAWNIAQWKVLSDFIIEWRSTFAEPFVGRRAFWAYIVYMAGGLALGIACRKRLSATPVLLFVFFALLATQRQRYVALFAYIGLYCFARTIDHMALRVPVKRMLAPAGAALGALAIAAVVRYGNMYGAWPHTTSSDNFSLLMSEYIREHHLEGNVWNSYTLGAQLIHDFYPQLKPLIDSRIDVYGEPYFLYTVHMGVNEQALLDFIERYHVRYFLLTWGEFNYRIGTMPKLRENGWRMLFADHKAVLLGRELPEKR
jgi:hypothetical protein